MSERSSSPPPSFARQHWRRLLWPALLALTIHVTVLLSVRLPAPSGPVASVIEQPLVYSPPPATPRAAQQPARRAAPAPAAPSVSAAQPAPPTPAPALPDPPPEARPETPTPPAPPVAPAAAPAAIPGSARLKYTLEGEINGLRYHARGELLWAHDGRQYEARMEIGAFLLGSRVQRSLGRVTPQGLQPQRFVDRVHSDRVAEFDYERQEIRFSEGAPAMAIPPRAQDQLSALIELAARIGADPERYTSGSTIEVSAVGVYGPESWSIVVAEKEHLSLPGGDVDALKLTRTPQKADEPRVELWLAPTLGWLPVRIRLTQGANDYIDQLWKETQTP